MKRRRVMLLLSAAILCSYSLFSGSAAANSVVDAKAQTRFYDPEQVQRIDLTIAEVDLRKMLEALPNRIYVPATFRWGDITIKNAAVRYKGNSSSRREQTHKRSFLVRFDEYDKDGRFLGLQRVSFDNGVQFGSLFSEPIVTEVLRDLKIPTHRSNYAVIYLNGKHHGVYVNVERIDDVFVTQYLTDPSGALFKVDEGGPGCNLQFLGTDLAPYEKTFEPKSKGAEKRLGELIKLIRFLNESEPDGFARQLESKLELDDFLEVTAVLLFAGAFDQLTGWNPHNYYLYQDPGTGRWRYLPWDLDVGFSETAFGRIRVLDDWNAAWPTPPSHMPNPLLERIVSDRALLERYRAKAREILERYFEPERISKALDAKYELIESHLKSDPFPPRRVTNPRDRGYADILASMKTFARKRYAAALQQLNAPGPRPKIERRPDGLPPGLPPELAMKIRRVHELAQRFRKRGGDLRPVQEIMRKLGPLVQQKKFKEAQALVGEALRLLGDASEG